MNDKTAFIIGITISLTSWFAAWMILAIKLDAWTFIGFILYGLGLSGLIIYVFIPKVIDIMMKKTKKRGTA